MSEITELSKSVAAFQPELVAAGRDLFANKTDAVLLPDIEAMVVIRDFLDETGPNDLSTDRSERVAVNRERLAYAGRAMLSRQITNTAEHYRNDGFNTWRQSVIDGPDEGVLDQVRAWVVVSIADHERAQKKVA